MANRSMTEQEKARRATALARLYGASLALSPHIRLAKVMAYLPRDLVTKWEEALEDAVRHYRARPGRATKAPRHLEGRRNA